MKPGERPEQMARTIREFVAGCRSPRLLEEGDEPLDLGEDNWSLAERGGNLWLEASDDRRTLRSRIAGTGAPGRRGLEVAVVRFGGRESRLVLFDRDLPAARAALLRGSRLVSRERLRRLLHRQFPGFRIVELSGSPNLKHSLSPVYPRAFLRQGGRGWAAILAPAEEERSDGALSFGLIWLDYLRRRERRITIEGLALFLPAGRERNTCLRLQWLHAHAVKAAVFLYEDNAEEGPVDAVRHGNLDTVLERSGSKALRRFGQSAEAPEALLEAQVRRHLRVIDPWLEEAPVYGQVPEFAGGERSILDLLALDRDGRLVVIELKASADLHLHMQALDYWMRVRWHAERGDFARYGYFAGKTIREMAPRLLLVAPALEFHPTTEALLRFLTPEIEVERVGVGVEWQKELRVVFRLRGAQRPR